MAEKLSPYGALEFDPATGEIGEVRVFDTADERRSWVAERPEARQTRRGDKARWLIERRDAGAALLPVNNHNGRDIAPRKYPSNDELLDMLTQPAGVPEQSGSAPAPELTPQDWTRLTDSVGFLIETMAVQLGARHRATELLDLALRYAFEANRGAVRREECRARRGEGVMLRANQVQVKLACGATVILTVRVERRGCTTGGADCPLASDVAGMIWLALKDSELEEPAPQ